MVARHRARGTEMKIYIFPAHHCMLHKCAFRRMPFLSSKNIVTRRAQNDAFMRRAILFVLTFSFSLRQLYGAWLCENARHIVYMKMMKTSFILSNAYSKANT